MSAAPEPVQLDLMEEQRRQIVMRQHESRHATRLQIIREAMAQLYRERLVLMDSGAYVSGNDVRRFLERHPEWDKPGESANWRAAVFASRAWQWTGEMVKTTARGGHRCRLQTYRLRER